MEGFVADFANLPLGRNSPERVKACSGPRRMGGGVEVYLPLAPHLIPSKLSHVQHPRIKNQILPLDPL